MIPARAGMQAAAHGFYGDPRKNLENDQNSNR
jgi:hypothetical protein